MFPAQLTHLLVGVAVPGLLATREDLPEHNAEAPDVRLDGEAPVQDALGGHPADRQQRPAAELC